MKKTNSKSWIRIKNSVFFAARRKEGFTMLEVMLGLLMLSCLMLGLNTVSFSFLGAQKRSQQFTGGVAVGKKHLETCRSNLSQPAVYDSVAALMPDNATVLEFPVIEDTHKGVTYTIERSYQRAGVDSSSICFKTRVKWSDFANAEVEKDVDFQIYLRKSI